MQATPTVLLADADVLIDYRESELAILNLVVQHMGRVAVVPSVLEEVRGVTAVQCVHLGVEVIEVSTDRMLQAAKVESSVSFNDRLCLVVCREEGWTCVTNDGALRRLCKRHAGQSGSVIWDNLLLCLYLRLKIDDEEGEIARYLDTEEVRWGGSMEWNPKCLDARYA